MIYCCPTTIFKWHTHLLSSFINFMTFSHTCAPVLGHHHPPGAATPLHQLATTLLHHPLALCHRFPCHPFHLHPGQPLCQVVARTHLPNLGLPIHLGRHCSTCPLVAN